MRLARVAFFSASIALAACSSGGDRNSEARVAPLALRIDAVPATLVEGAVTQPITVSVVDGGGTVRTDQTPAITLSLEPANGVALLGTTTATAVAGVATFDALELQGEGADLRWRAEAAGFTPATSTPFEVQPRPVQVVITSAVPSTLTPFEAFDVTVELRSVRGTLVTGATDTVTLGGGPMPHLLWHASGDTREIVEVVTAPAVVRTHAGPFATGEVTGACHDPSLGLIRVVDANGAFALANAGSGDEVRYRGANTATLPLRGLVIVGGEVHTSIAGTTSHRVIDLHSGVDVEASAATFTMPGVTIDRVKAFAAEPTTGAAFAIVPPVGGGFGPHRFAAIDLTTAVLTDRNSLGAAFGSLTFADNGTCYGVTEDGGTPPETLFRIDPATAFTTALGALGNGGTGEIVVALPRTPRGPRSAAAQGGVATFTGVWFEHAGSGYVLEASVPGIGSTTTGPIQVTGSPTPTATVAFAAAAATVAENVAGGLAQVTLQLSAAQPHVTPVMVTVDAASTATIGGAAPDAAIAGAFELLVPANTTSITFDVPIADDTAPETDETLVLTIRSANLATGIGATATHTLSIQSNE